MKKLTQRQAAEIVNDPANWRPIEVTHFFRSYIFEPEIGLAWVRIDHRAVLNVVEIIAHKAAPKVGFGFPRYYEYDQLTDSLGFECTKNQITNKLWREAGKEHAAPSES